MRRIHFNPGRMAPLASLVVLLLASRWLPTRVQADERTALRQTQIRETIERLPFFVGDDWVGEDLRDLLAPEAQELLRPNAIFNRRYERDRDTWVHLLVVHCSDARDMIGHYPPVCYPNAGWVALDVPPPADLVIETSGAMLPVRTYRFRAMQEGGGAFEVRIFNAFVLPDGTVTRHISDINRQSERLAVSVQGVAQLQIITPARLARDEALSDAGEVLEGLEDLLRVLGVTADSTGRSRT